jgi:nucleoside-diphosphate-sugar epimerase
MDPVVVLGAGGFLGRAVCDTLVAAGRPVVAFLRKPPPRPLPNGCRTIEFDLVGNSPETLALELGAIRPAAVVNAAGALWDVTDEQLVEGNVHLVERLLTAMTALPRRVRLVHLGSAYEYGAQPPGLPLLETLDCRPESRYARTKLAGTGLIAQTVAADRADAVVLRVAVTTGPHAPACSAASRASWPGVRPSCACPRSPACATSSTCGTWPTPCWPRSARHGCRR